MLLLGSGIKPGSELHNWVRPTAVSVEPVGKKGDGWRNADAAAPFSTHPATDTDTLAVAATGTATKPRGG